MNSDAVKEFLNSGRVIIRDTKLKKPKSAVVEAPAPVKEGDIHQQFVRRTIEEKPKKSDIIEEFKKIIKIAETEL